MKNFKRVIKKEIPLPVKAAAWFTVCNFLLKGISFVTVPIFAKVLSTEEYGTVSIYNSYQQVLLIFATLELSLGAYTRGSLKYKERIAQFTSNLLVLSNLITLGVFGIVLLGRNVFYRLTDTSILVLVASFFVFFLQPAYNCWMYRKRYRYQYKEAVAVTITFSVFTTLIPLICVLKIAPTANIKILCTLLVSAVIYFPFYVKSIHLKDLIGDMTFFKETCRFSLMFQLPLVMHSLSFLVLGQADRMMIGEMVGKSEAAIYSVAYSLASVVTIFQTSINQVFQPYRYRKMEEGDTDAIKKTTNALLLFFAMLTICFILVAPDMIRLLFDKEYHSAVWTIPPVALSVFFMFLYSIFVDVESYYEKTTFVMIASVICAIINIVLNYEGIKRYGYIACGYTTLISYIFFAFMHYIFMRCICREKGITEGYFNVKFILAVSIVLTAIGVTVTFLYQYIVPRYIIMGMIFIYFIIDRKRIKVLVAQVRR